MIRVISTLFLAALAVARLLPADELTSGQVDRIKDLNSSLAAHRDKVLQDSRFADWMKRLDGFIDKKYVKVETPLDSEAGKVYLASRIQGEAKPVSPTNSGTSEMPAARNRSDDPLTAEDDLRGGDDQHGSQTRPAAPARVDESFRDSITRFDDVKAFVVRELYADAGKLKINQDGVTMRGLHPFFLFHYIGPKSNRLADDPVKKLARFFNSDSVRDQFSGFVTAYATKGDEPKRALALLDAYVQLRRAAQSDNKRAAAFNGAKDFASTLSQNIAIGKEPVEGGASAVTTSYHIWSYQADALGSIVKTANTSEAGAAASVYAWMADAIVLIDLNKRSAGNGQGRGADDQTKVTLEEYQARLGALDDYVRGVRSRQSTLLNLLQKYQGTDDQETHDTLRKQILDLYAGTRSQRPLPVMIADIDDHPNVAALAKGPPQGADEATKDRFKLLFDRQSGGIPRMHTKQDVIDEAMLANGFGDVVEQGRARVEQERTRRAKAGPGAPGSDDPGGDNGRNGSRNGGSSGFGNGLRGLGDAMGPLSDQLFKANEQRDRADLQQRRIDSEQARMKAQRDEDLRNKQDEREINEQRTANHDAVNSGIEDAQRLVDRDREEQRQRDLAYQERQRQLAAERQKAAQLSASQSALLPVQNTGLAGPSSGGLSGANGASGTAPALANPSGPQSVAGPSPRPALPAGPAAPVNSVGVPANSPAPAVAAPQGATPMVLTDSQLIEIAKSKVPLLPNAYGIDPAVLTPEEIKAALDPVINAKVEAFNQQLREKGITVNADLQYSGKGIQSTGRPANYDRYEMWLTRFPEMRAAANQAAQAKYQALLQGQINILSAARADQQRQIAAQQRQQPVTGGPTAVAQTPAPVITPAPQAPPPAASVASAPAAPTTSTSKTKPEDPKFKAAQKVIDQYDEKAGGKSGIQPPEFLGGLDRYNSSQPYALDISLPSLVKLVKSGFVKSRVQPPTIAEDLGPEGAEAQKVIDEYDRQAGGKSGISPADFLRARDFHNASDPYKVELNLPGLIRLVNNGRVHSNVPPPSLSKANQPSPTPSPDSTADDNRFGNDPTSR